MAIVACHKEAPQEVQVLPEVPMVESSQTGTSAEPSDGSSGNPDRTVITLPTGSVEVTVQDGAVLREALLKRLRASDVPDRDELLLWTEHASATIGPDRVFRLGRWILGDHFGALALTNRLRQTDQGALIYVAPVAKESGGWTVQEVEPEIAHARR